MCRPVVVVNLTVDHVQGDRVRLGVGGRAGELAGVPQVGPGDPERAHQPPALAPPLPPSENGH